MRPRLRRVVFRGSLRGVVAGFSGFPGSPPCKRLFKARRGDDGVRRDAAGMTGYVRVA